MDGLKRGLKDSIQFQLSCSLSLAILVVAIIAGITSFHSAFDEANELQDDMLRQMAALFERRQMLPLANDNEQRIAVSDGDSRVIVQYFSGEGRTKWNDVPGINIPTDLAQGFHTLPLERETYRVLVKPIGGAERIAVAQATAVRDEIARDSATRTIGPLLILVPVLLFVVATLIRRLFRPISKLAREIDRRSERDLQSIDPQGLPSEIHPFVVAINRLLGRVEQSMEHQRRFVADAAHELRSPMTAMSLQAERLGESEMSEEASKRLAALQRGLHRSKALLEKLLQFASVQSSIVPVVEKTSIQRVFRQVLEDLMPLAEAKNLDIGVDGNNDALILVPETYVVMIIKNLVDNAIRYTPNGGRVDLSMKRNPQGLAIEVRDSGPGIPIEDRQRVFDPFYRILGTEQSGTGLGLSIVKTIADKIDAVIVLSSTDVAFERGLCVSVQIAQAKIDKTL